MKTRALALSCLLLAAPASAQDGYTPPMADDPWPGQTAPGDDGLGMIERGMGMLLDQFWSDIEPGLNSLGQDMSGALSRFAPVMNDLAVLMDDLGNYQGPERLENGDIIIRRKPGSPPPPPIGDNLREFTMPRPDAAPDAPSPSVPLDPYAPEIEL